uniref:Uncharacterized protein n=1 Tax=viral metagenome TaxID=1070528 RepID=A0A6M3L0M1_9ZZZZ
MQIKVRTNYNEENIYTCESEVCEQCGLRFVCYTERDKAELDWKSFCAVLKSKNKPLLVYKGSNQLR